MLAVRRIGSAAMLLGFILAATSVTYNGQWLLGVLLFITGGIIYYTGMVHDG